MHLKRFFGILVVFAALFVTTNVYAATSASIGNVSKTTINGTEYTIVPIYITSTDYQNIQALDADLYYDNTKYSYVMVDTKLSTKNILGQYSVTSPTVGSNNGYVSIVWTTASNALGDISYQDGLCYDVYFTGSGDVTANDFSLKVNNLGLYDTATSTLVKTEDEGLLASYVYCDIPVTVGDDWTYGYIYGLYATVKETGTDTVLAEKVQLLNYVEADGNYRFIVKLKPSKSQTKKVVDVEFIADTAETENAETFTQQTIKTINGVTVEYLNAK